MFKYLTSFLFFIITSYATPTYIDIYETQPGCYPSSSGLKCYTGYKNIFAPNLGYENTTNNTLYYEYKTTDYKSVTMPYKVGKYSYYSIIIPKGAIYGTKIVANASPSNAGYKMCASYQPNIDTSASIVQDFQIFNNIIKDRTSSSCTEADSFLGFNMMDLPPGKLYIALTAHTSKQYNGYMFFTYIVYLDKDIYTTWYNENYGTTVPQSPVINTFQDKNITACASGSTTFTASGGSGDYSWKSSSDEVGSINSTTGKLTYKTDVVGTFATDINVTDSNGNTSLNKRFTLNVELNKTLKDIQDQDTSFDILYEKDFHSELQCQTASNKITNWTIQITKDGNDISLNANEFSTSTGKLSWIPSVSGVYTVKVEAKQNASDTNPSIQAYKLNVTRPQSLAFNDVQDINLTANMPSSKNTIELNEKLIQSGSTPINWYVMDPMVLPVGFELNSTTGILTWDNPPEQNTTFTFRAKNSVSVIEKEVSINVIAINPVKINFIDNFLKNAGDTFTYSATLASGASNFISWSALYFKNGKQFTNENIITKDGKITINNLQEGTYTVKVSALDEKLYETAQSLSKDRVEFNITVVKPISIVSLVVSDQNGSNYTKLVKQGYGTLKATFAKSETNVTIDANAIAGSAISQLDSVSDINGAFYDINLSNLSVGSTAQEYNITVKASSDGASDTEVLQNVIIATADYVNLLKDDNSSFVIENEVFTAPEGSTKTFKFNPIGFGGASCNITATGLVVDNSTCTITINSNVASKEYPVTIDVTSPPPSNGNRSINIKINVVKSNIIPIIMYLLN